MTKIPVTVCIIAKDGERYIEECLKRLLPYGFEIIVTDTGSSDRTREIAEKYADKVLDFEWVNDFSKARNFCADHASNNWVLSIDCDEYVQDLDVSRLRMFMQKFSKLNGILRLTNVMYNEIGEKIFEKTEVIRLYNRKRYRYVGAIHEQLLNISDGTAASQVFLVPMEIVHMGYAISPEEMRIKQQRNLDMLNLALENEPDNPYLIFQIGQSEYIIGNKEGSIAYYEKALGLNPDINIKYVRLLIFDLALAYKETGRLEEAVIFMDKYAGACNDAKFVYMHASIYLDCGDIIKALAQYLKVVSLPDANTLGAGLLDCYDKIVAIYNAIGKPEMAAMFIEKRNQFRAENERILSA